MAHVKPSKRRRLDRDSYHDRIDLTDDFEVIHTRETRKIEHGRFVRDTPRDPLKGHTTWTAPDVSWVPEDDPEFALDPDGDWYDVELRAPIADSTAFKDAPTHVRLKKKKTLRSVRSMSANSMVDFINFFWLETAPCVLEAEFPNPVSRRNAEMGGEGGPSRGKAV